MIDGISIEPEAAGDADAIRRLTVSAFDGRTEEADLVEELRDSGDMLLKARRLDGLPGNWLRFILYIPWLLIEIFRANMHVMRLVFHPRMMDLIDPRMIQFESRLNNEMARFIYANSITLTPGTLTTDVRQDHFMVHSLTSDGIDELRKGGMESQIQRLGI